MKARASDSWRGVGVGRDGRLRGRAPSARVTLVGCWGGAGAKFASIKAGDMPEGESWVGVYYNPVYGYLHMIEQDGNIVGRWKRTDSSHWGEMSGTAEGNVVHFTWKEHAYGARSGRNGTSHGRGRLLSTSWAPASTRPPSSTGSTRSKTATTWASGTA